MSAAGSTIHDCRMIELPRLVSPEGHMTFVEDGALPFEVARLYYLYDVPGGAERGGHAHRDLEQLIVCVMGGFTVDLHDGATRTSVRLDRAHRGLYVAPMIWREMRDFTSGSICLVLASARYDESDYVRSFDEFRRIRGMRVAVETGEP